MALAVRVLLIVLLAILIHSAVRASIENLRFSDYVAYGNSSDGNSTISIGDEKKSMEMVASCRTDIFEPGLRLRIFKLNQSNPSKNYRDWYNAIEAAEKYVTAAIRCAPFRGDSWLRSAIVSQSIAEEPQRLSTIMQYASSLNPVEHGQLMTRLALWARASGETQRLSNSLISNDVEVLLRYGDGPAIASALHSNSEYVRGLAASILEKLPVDRQRAIENMDVK